ncbi:MAG: DUF5666 domain-containing protein [Granulosicoccus sp.]
MGRQIGIILWTLLVLAGCNSDDPGSGGGIGGSGIRPVIVTGATSGSISGFGSIFVNGGRFDTDNAIFLINDNPVSQGDLRIGMNVLAAVDFSSNVASQVDYVASLIGPVDMVNVVDNAFQSMGQTVKLGGGTRYENISLAEISPGMVLEVSGLRDATGRIFATFIRPAPDTTRFQLVGTVLSDLDERQMLTISGLTVNITQADLSQISTDELEFGDKVYVTADSTTYDSTGPSLLVDSVRVALEPMVAAGDRVEYEGMVSTFTSPFDFDIYWQPVSATDQTRVEFQDGTLADLSMIMLNTRLEVEAIVQENGAYQASKIILIETENSTITGAIEQITPDTASFTVLGLDIQVTDRTRYDGSSDDDADQDIGSFGELAVGDYVEIDASFLGNRLIANAVEVDDPNDRAILEGPVTALDITPEKIDVMNIPISLDAQTSYENRDDEQISKEEFFEQLRVGVVVKVRWDEFQSESIAADKLAIE